MSIKLPTFDISQPFSSSSLSSLSEACREWGFFHVTNHGIPNDLCRIMYSVSSQIFNLPPEVKNKAGPLSTINTYTPHFIASPFFESLRVSGPDFFGSAHSSSRVLMDQSDGEFSEIVQEYGNRMTHLSKTILKAIIESLGLNFDTKYLAEFNNCHGYMRINHYSLPGSSDGQEIEGLGMHTDMSCITVVWQDEIGGLQVRSKEGQWMEISAKENALVVNIGDLLQAWSNDKLRSSEHRVVLRKNVNRLSVAFFWCFEDEQVVCAPEEVVGEGNSRVYKPFACGDYVKFRENSEKGKFEKVGFTVKHFAGTQM
ncbi:2-oxoglutarate (2OG) and Fe(II)-dependent oxygenase superfamily protein [Striga hermonthica]|uniref:2-oxoglutarate (2OG) and Fe(II)-dependent oxygenase superfamily protein n=1 Tax=Striga hermonthica TaxID=68872 RepID=A0A9N7NCQ8_STRHE|nr:2-oxoglutarate (2OG) and Fe(II)-dependent oxygenase superfamily protein [Striga hermonthica]